MSEQAKQFPELPLSSGGLYALARALDKDCYMEIDAFYASKAVDENPWGESRLRGEKLTNCARTAFVQSILR